MIYNASIKPGDGYVYNLPKPSELAFKNVVIKYTFADYEREAALKLDGKKFNSKIIELYETVEERLRPGHYLIITRHVFTIWAKDFVKTATPAPDDLKCVPDSCLYIVNLKHLSK